MTTSDRVRSTTPELLDLSDPELRNGDEPIWVVGSGKTAMDTAHALVTTCPDAHVRDGRLDQGLHVAAPPGDQDDPGLHASDDDRLRGALCTLHDGADLERLDPVGRRDFLRELVDDVIERGTTVLFSTHILSDLERIAVDVAFLKDGRIALQAALDELLEGTRRVSGDARALATLQLDQELGRVRHDNGAFSIVARLSAQESVRLLASPGVRLDPVSLEDLFEEVTR